jgi:cobyrinic acid a,c-diamide synthase
MVSPLSPPLPRLLLAAPGSGHGKTTVASGLMAALRARGFAVAPFKVGPDYIDPGYHALATGRPGRNLDPHLCAEDSMVPLLLHGAATPTPADVAVIEGVMGLFDGRIGGDGYASSAHIARLTDTPVVLVLDVSAMSRTAAAIVHGLATFDTSVRVAGVILNQAGSARHAREVSGALAALGVPVLGVLPRDAGVHAPSRHLGLVPAAERADPAGGMVRLAELVAEHVDLAGVLDVARSAPPLAGTPWDPTAVVRPPSTVRPVVAVAGGRAFTFRYAETEELLRAAGCEPVTFDPLTDPALPDGTAGIYLGGGFPEEHAAELAANAGFTRDLRAAVDAGVPTVAECAGLLYLARAVDGVPMVGAIDVEAEMSPRLTLGYRTATAPHDTLLAVAGDTVTGHEFHRTGLTAQILRSPAWQLGDGPDGCSLDPAGTGTPTLHAAYLHTHWAGHPQLAQRFADAVHAYAVQPVTGEAAPGPRTDGALCAEPEAESRPKAAVRGVVRRNASRELAAAAYDLNHHGDSDLADGLVDLAVNVRVPTPPAWLADVITATTPDLAAYPRPDVAVAAIATAHGVRADQVLPTAGAAEAFTLLARALRPAFAVVVHPQFTEPEAALRTAGHHVRRLVLNAGDGFALDPRQVPEACDLVVIGNPTNPTSVLHPAETLRRLARPGRSLVVDEAFMDAVPGGTESLLAGGDLAGIVVLRSLTKTWGLAGLRAGYAVGDPRIIRALSDQQPPWGVSTPALAVIAACLTPDAMAIAAAAAKETAHHRNLLVRALTNSGLVVAGAPAAPFVLVDCHGWRPGRAPGYLRAALAEHGFAVRRGETFPGLDADWIRLAVRDEATTKALAKALTVLRESE